MKYPTGTLIKSRSTPKLSGKIVEHRKADSVTINIVEWNEGQLEHHWKNEWSDHDIGGDRDKVITLPVLLDEELFEI